MATDLWNGSGNWITTTSDWSLGVPPTSSDDAIIQSGTDTLNSGAGVAKTVTVLSGSTLDVELTATLNAANLTNYGAFDVDVDGGTNGGGVTLTGTFNNTGTATIGNPILSASTTVTAAGFSNTGTVVLWGNETLGTTEQATLDITSAAPSTLTGSVYLHGDADLEFKSGGITTIANGVELQLDGEQSRVSIGAGTTNSALMTLATILGTLDLEGNWSTGPGGTSVTTNTSLLNTGTLDIDTYSQDGDSQMTVGGALTNTGTVYIGNGNLSDPSSLTVNSLTNQGTITVFGNITPGTTEQATFDVKGAAPSTWTGALYAAGDSLVEFASGDITSIAVGSTIGIFGNQARISIGAGTTNSALDALATNYGTYELVGNSGDGSGGVVAGTSVAFINYGSFDLDSNGYDGGSSFTASQSFTNDDYVQVGNSNLTASSTLTVGSLVNNGVIFVDSQNLGGAGEPQAAIDVLSAAPSTSTGYLRVEGDSVIDYASGAIQSIASGATIELDGGAASIAIGSNGQNSALATLSSNAGLLLLRGDNGFGSGVTLTTTTAYTNTGTTEIDYYAYDGGSNVTFGGALTNSGTLDIGNNNLTVNTTVAAASFVNTGVFTLQGATTGSGSPEAQLDITMPASATVSGAMRIGGNATLNYGSGTGFTSITRGSYLELDGSSANISIGAGAQNSGLASLASNAGTLVLRGNSSYGVGGVALTTTTSFTNTGTTYIDAYAYDGGSDITFGGVLTNSGTFELGNTNLTSSSTVNVMGLTNSGSLTIQGATGASGPVATLNDSSSASVVVTNFMRIGGEAKFDLGSGSGIIGVAAGGWLELDGENANVAIGAGAHNSGLANLNHNYGTLLIRGDSSYGVGGVTISTHVAFTNTGTTYIDAYAYDGGSDVTFGGGLTNSGTLEIGNTNISANTTVAATSFVSTGVFVLQGGISGSGSPEAQLDVAMPSSVAVSGTMRISGNATLNYGSGNGYTSINRGGWLELDGSNANISIGTGTQNSGLALLSSNAGALVLRGNSGFGVGGVTLTTTTSFTNTGTTYIDAYAYDGGSDVTFGGVLNNSGTFDLGNMYLTSSSTVNVTGLTNTGSLTIQGASGATGPVATLNDSSSASVVVTGFMRIGGEAKFDLGSGSGIVGVAAGGWLELDGENANVAIGAGAQNSGLANLNHNYGTLLIRGDSGFGVGGVTISTNGAFTNTGSLDIDYYGGDGGSSFTFGGALTNQGGTINIGNTGNSAATNVSATILYNLAGQINLSAGGYATTLSISGAAINDAGLSVGAGANLSATGAFTQNGGATVIYGTLTSNGYNQNAGATTVYGTLASKTVNDHGGTMTYNSALTAASTTTALNLENGATLDFTAAVSSSQTVTFQDATDTLDLAAAGTFGATISGFQAGDAIDLLNQAATTLSYSSGVLDVYDGGTLIAALKFAGSYTNSSFVLTTDNHGGSLIVA